MLPHAELSENAIRKRLKRAGYLLRKRRSPTAIELYGDGYMIVDGNNVVVGGGSRYGASDDRCTMTLEDCENWVRNMSKSTG